MTPCGDIVTDLGWHRLMAPSHYMNQHWLIISDVLWHSPKGNITGNAQDIYIKYEFKITNLRLHLHLPVASELTFSWIWLLITDASSKCISLKSLIFLLTHYDLVMPYGIIQLCCHCLKPSRIQTFLSKKCIWKCYLQNGSHLIINFYMQIF